MGLYEGQTSARPSSWVVAPNESIVIGGVELWPDVRSGRVLFGEVEFKIVSSRGGKRLVNITAPPGRIASIERCETANGNVKQLVVRMRETVREASAAKELALPSTARPLPQAVSVVLDQGVSETVGLAELSSQLATPVA